MCSVKVLYSALFHLPPLRFLCADVCWDRPLQLVHWQSDALTTRLDLIHSVKVAFTSATVTLCECSHLTNFGLMFDISGAFENWDQTQLAVLR